MANTIGECNIMVRAARRYNRIVQVGQQQRDGKVFIDCMELIKSGKIGTLRKVNIWANFNYGLGAQLVDDEESRCRQVSITISGWGPPGNVLSTPLVFTGAGVISGITVAA